MLSVWAQFPVRGEIIGQSLLKHYTTSEIEGVYAQLGIPTFLSPINYEVDLYKVQYWTPDTDGTSLVPATGVVLYPSNYACGAPVILYHHVTTFWDTGVPSDLGLEALAGIPFSANGYIVLIPDYLGLGDSPGRHPYLHAETEAGASIDMIRSARILSDTLDIDWNDQLFLTGYSQGGHAGMATFREIETNLSNEFAITSVSLGGGPYDLSTTTRDAMLAPLSNPTNSYNIVYVILSYQEVYGTLYDSLEQYFVAPYDSLIPLIFQREGALTSLPLADTAVAMFEDSVVQAIQTDSLHPLNVALRANDLYDWTPQAPLRLYYCEADEEVPHQNSLIARDQMQLNGAPTVTALSAGATLDHNACFAPTLLQTKFYFDGQRQLCGANALDPRIEIGLQVYPNPAHSQVHLRWEAEKAGMQQIQLLTLNGKVLQELTLSSWISFSSLSVKGLPSGLYAIRFIGEWSFVVPLQVN